MQFGLSDFRSEFRKSCQRLGEIAYRGKSIEREKYDLGMTQAPARIVFLDDSEDLRQLMQILLKSTLGVECSCFGSLREFERHSDEVLHARVAILDINLGPEAPDGVDAFNWLMDHGFSGKIVFFTGHARSNPQVVRAQGKGAEILEKPLRPDKLISTVTRYLEAA